MNFFYKMVPRFTHRDHFIHFYPKEPLLHPHLCNLMRVSDSIQYDIPKPIKYAIYDSSPFDSDDTLSDDTSSQHNLSLSPSNAPSKPIFQDNWFYNDSGFQSITKTHQPNPSYRTRHHSQNDTPIHHNPINGQTKTHDNLTHQPQKDYRLFLPQSKLFDS